MKYSAIKYISILPGLLIPLLSACTDEMMHEDNTDWNNSDMVTFSPGVEAADAYSTRGGGPLYEPLELNGEEEFPVYLHTWEHPISEQPNGEASIETRGLQVESAAKLEEIHKSFGVCANVEASGSTYIPMSKTKPLPTGDSRVWVTESANHWPGTERLCFNAVAPHSETSNLKDASYTKNSISFSYEALKGDGTNDAEKQVDLLTAVGTYNREATKPTNYRVPLKFNHALSAIKFAVRDVLKGKVISVSIKGVKGKGDCVYTADDNSGNGHFEWSNHSGNATYTQVFNHEIENGNFDPEDDSKDVVLNTLMPEKTFMLIPQEIPDEAEIEVEIERYNVVSPLASKIKVKGKIKANELKEWKAGYEYVYTISTSKDNWVYVFDAEGNTAGGKENIYVYNPNDARFDNSGNIAEYYVKSYRYKANDQNFIEPLPWKASHGGSYSYVVNGSEDTAFPAGNPDQKFVSAADWLTDTFATPLSGKGSVEKEEHCVDFLPHYVVTDWIGDETMQGRAPYGTKAAPYDLSKFGGAHSRTTANCYIVDRGGWYMFPLVYGNAIKNGSTNASAYTCQNTSTSNSSGVNLYILKTLTDYNDKPISGPNISTPPAACANLIWEDAYSLIEEVELVSIGGEQMIRFYIEPNDIQQGNAIIALLDKTDGNVMWSWHIWATEHWNDPTSRLPHAYDTGNSRFNTYLSSEALNENGAKIGLRECGDVEVTYNQKNRSFWMAAYNLGWCDPKKVIYLKRKNKMDYVQYLPDGTTPSGHTDKLDVIQDGVTIDYKYANNTYYQWGRKDPIRGYFNHEHEEKRVFGPRQSEMKYLEEIGGVTIGTAIQHPEIFYASNAGAGTVNEDWLGSKKTSNLWNNHKDSNVTSWNNDNDHEDMWCHLKTVYDPSPAGYMVPNAGVWHVVQKNFSNAYTFSDGSAGSKDAKKEINSDEETAAQRDTWSGGNWAIAQFRNKVNGARFDDYNFRVWGKGNANNLQEALFFSSTGNKWWTSAWKPGKYNGTAGGNFGRNCSYAWSNRFFTGNQSYGMALGLDTDRELEGDAAELRYYVGGQFIGRRTMGRPVRAIREP